MSDDREHGKYKARNDRGSLSTRSKKEEAAQVRSPFPSFPSLRQGWFPCISHFFLVKDSRQR